MNIVSCNVYEISVVVLEELIKHCIKEKRKYNKFIDTITDVKNKLYQTTILEMETATILSHAMFKQLEEEVVSMQE